MTVRPDTFKTVHERLMRRFYREWFNDDRKLAKVRTAYERVTSWGRHHGLVTDEGF